MGRRRQSVPGRDHQGVRAGHALSVPRRPGSSHLRRSATGRPRRSRDALPLQPGLQESGIDGSGGDSAVIGLHSGSHDGPRRGAGERARLHHESVCDAGHTPGISVGETTTVHCPQHDQLLRSRRAGRGRVQGSPQGQLCHPDVGRSCVCDRHDGNRLADVRVHP